MEGNSTIDHFLHSHPLKLIDEEEVNHEFRCKGCKESLSALSPAPIYGCGDCKFYLHKGCAELPKEMQHFFHPCPLFLSILSFTCNACSKNGHGFSYRCTRCDFDMHLECAQRPINIELESDGDDHEKIIIQHFTHWHPLTLLDEKDHLQVGCGICQKLICFDSDSGSVAAYGCEECKVYLHKSCMINIPRQINNHLFHPSCSAPLILLTTSQNKKCKGCDDEPVSGLVFCCEIHHYFHPWHPLTLSSLPTDQKATNSSSCDSCLGSIDEFLLVYRCAKCDFNLHLDCANHTLSSRPLLVKCERHSHHLTFFDKTRAAAVCHFCDKLAQNCYFRCVACRFKIHLYCHPCAPKTIKHKCHLHPLTLTESPFQFELISPEYQEDASESDDEFYCDVCEEKRFKHESVYYCKECKFIAETRCVISELLPCLTGSEGHPTGDGRAISANEKNSAIASIADLKNEMAELKEEKKPLKLEIEQLKARLEELEAELKRKKCKFIAETRCIISELLPPVTGSEGHHTIDKNSAPEASIAKRGNEIAQLRAEQGPLTLQIEKLEATLQALKDEEDTS
ncbi:Zinc finger, PHD-type [Corchorus olitorius]|uniref:Zinc finger, PHD-type n=1 Tax=Corchorus olitorius TaxID=93759 RepID=A0A1R3KT02_9ROSI|nr:Zinc finger, PHD-type [Corchorus olitorius]